MPAPGDRPTTCAAGGHRLVWVLDSAFPSTGAPFAVAVCAASEGSDLGLCGRLVWVYRIAGRRYVLRGNYSPAAVALAGPYRRRS
jgi:hypothetical protein